MTPAYARPADERVDLIHNIPYLVLHLAPLGVLWTGFTSFDVALCAGFYVLRLFFITAGYHRYFSHRAYKMGRVMQFLMALGGTLAVQKGPLWWAGLHRHHHKYSDQIEDVHSPLKGFFWSHMGWIMCRKYRETPTELIKDFAKFPELRWLNKYHWVPPLALGFVVFFAWGASALFFGYFLSLVLAWHGTYFINSLTHLFGRRRYVTTDTSRNSFILALLTLGEGWHNNHHYYQSTANQGFFWWEIDISYYILKVLSWVGLVRDLRTPPAHVLEANRIRDGHADIGMFQAKWASAVAYLENARAQAGEYYGERKRAIDEIVETTTSAAQELARQRKEAVDTMVRDTSAAAQEIARMTQKAPAK
ncbi:MAG: fatty acid desaturase [Myxococcales bacterium]|nr:fatty acid desaturase [Myxococcales bacterium]